MASLVLTKHHGLGNDFLVLLDFAGTTPVDAARAVALCDGQRGVGADGVLRVTAGTEGADVTMELRNADGSAAQMSGNGISCLAQAVVDAGVAPWPELSVATAAGVRQLVVSPETRRGLRVVTVDMGAVNVTANDGGEEAGLLVDVGNPHLVLPDTGQDLVGLGLAHADLNVELIHRAGPASIRMRVHERGVGLTDACGTGAVASAAAAKAWGMTLNGEITVHQPGGDARVRIDDNDVAWLTVAVQFVARIETL